MNVTLYALFQDCDHIVQLECMQRGRLEVHSGLLGNTSFALIGVLHLHLYKNFMCGLKKVVTSGTHKRTKMIQDFQHEELKIFEGLASNECQLHSTLIKYVH